MKGFSGRTSVGRETGGTSRSGFTRQGLKEAKEKAGRSMGFGFRRMAAMSAAAFAVAFAAVTAASSAYAAGEDVFVVARVPVQARADSATAAKNAAQASGRRRAMDILLRRLTPEEDWIYLPKRAASEPAEAAMVMDPAANLIGDAPSALAAPATGVEREPYVPRP